MEYTVQNVCGLLIRSKLMTPDEVKTMYQRWLAEAKDAAGNLAQFAKWLAANRYVTEYQATLVTRGHADDFFLGQYKILDRLGRGRMAGVYKASHQLGQVVAIKVLPPSRAREPQMLARFQREARLAMRLKHPNVVRAFQVGEQNGLHYLVMEYLEGETLDEVIQRRRLLPPAEAVRLLHQALLGLEHIHEQGLVHRDLKPSNLMLVPASPSGPADTTARATVKILDIGLGRALFEEASPAPPAGGLEKLQLTAEGVLLGTPDYLSPEQARDPRAIDIRSDIYSLGCVLYHALAGQPPFPDNNIISQMVRHATEAPRPLKAFNPAVQDGLQQIVSRMLQKDPAQRYATPEKAAQALQAFLAAGNEPAHGIEAEPQMRKYLTWLETGGNGANDPAATRPSPSGTVPSAAAREASTPRAPAKPPSGSQKAVPTPPPAPSTQVPGPRKHSKKHKRRRSALHTGAGKTSAAKRAEEFDVELVPAAATAKQPVPEAAPWRLSRRDWMLLGIGAGAVILAAGAGVLFAWLNAEDDDEEGDES
jgi:serine/threonine protein kinase